MTYPTAMETAIRAELGAEEVLWASAPGKMLYARRESGRVARNLFILSIITFWMGMFLHKSGSPNHWMFICFGLLILLVAFCQLITALVPVLLPGRLYYVITPQRAIIFEKTWNQRIHSFDATALTGFERISRGGRSGDLIFKRIMERRGKSASTLEFGFLGLASFVEPEALLKNIVQRHA